MTGRRVSRETFLRLGAAVSLAGVPLLSSCQSEEDLPEVGRGQVIVGEDKLKPNSAFTFADAGSGEPRILVRTERGDFAMYSAKCTHNGCTVGYWPKERSFTCPCHGSVFDLEDGAVVSGPAEEPLPKLEVQVEDGKVVSA